MKYINLNQITFIKFHLKRRLRPHTLEKCTWTENGGWWARLMGREKKIISGFRDDTWNGYYYYFDEEINQLLKDNSSYIGDDGEIYEYPHLEIQMSDGKTKWKFFKTENELNTWIEEAIKSVPTITIFK